MGNPSIYSLELPNRCLALIDTLWANVEHYGHLGDRFGGPLTTTFLLAMATPAIVVPVERMLTWWDGDRNADDRALQVEIAARLKAEFDQKRDFSDAPFFNHGDGWRYVYWEQRFNIAHGLPDELAKALNDDKATNAKGIEAIEAIRALRNALAHAVIAYLNEDGFSEHGATTGMLAFVSEKRDDKDRRKVLGYHVLRIPEAGFRSFLHRWVKWLNDTGVARAIAA